MPVQPYIDTLNTVRVFRTTTNAVPSAAGDGEFEVGDVILNGAPQGSGVGIWICTARGTGATATFKALTLGA
jgi:hypothetical protein